MFRLRRNQFCRQINLGKRTVQGIQNLPHGILYGKKFPSVVVANRQIHISLCHLRQYVINILDIFFQFPLGIMNGLHQHTNLGCIRFQ